MTTRTSGETVTFLHPFRLSGADELQPAGRYLVETDEELLQGLSFPAYRRQSTFMCLAGRANSNELARVVDIDPAELEAALARDAQVPVSAPILTDRTVAGVPARKRPAREVLTEGWNCWLALNANELTWMALVVGGTALAALFTAGAAEPP